MHNIEIKENNGIIVMHFSGELVFNETMDAEAAFQEQLAKKPRVIGLDCQKLTNMDSSGLGVFLKYSKEAIKLNVELILLNISDNISTLFDASKLNNFFEIMSTVEFDKIYRQ